MRLSALGDAGLWLQREVLLSVLGLVLGYRQHDAELGARGKAHTALPTTLWSLIEDIFAAGDATPQPSRDGNTSPGDLPLSQPS